MTDSQERNLRLFQWYVPFYSAHFWVAVWFLYFLSYFSVGEVLQLEALYFLTVVVFEIPSGYLSDRLGRVITLRLSAAMQVGSLAVFAFGPSEFWAFAIGQMLWAGSFSFYSGTDTAFHFDTLQAAGRTDEFAERQARMNRNAFIARAVCALLGGAIAVFGLKLAYLASLAVSTVTLLLTLMMREPPRAYAPSILRQMSTVLGYLKRPFIAWVFLYAVLQTTLSHIPYEFTQPYIAVVLGEGVHELLHTSWISGIIIAIVASVGAIAADRAIAVRKRLGAPAALVAITAVQCVLIAAMALSFSAWILPLLALRSVQSGIGQVIVTTEITPRIGQGQRATYLSLQSLAGRLAFSLVLWTLGASVAGVGHQEALESALSICLWLAIGSVLLLALTRPAAGTTSGDE
ncbi:MAG: MFS transporter [Pseudomonadales bacterium]